MDRRAQLGADKFENLQLMKSAWKKNLVDVAAWNSNQVEEVEEDCRVYTKLLREDVLISSWAETEGSFFDLDMSVFT